VVLADTLTLMLTHNTLALTLTRDALTLTLAYKAVTHAHVRSLPVSPLSHPNERSTQSMCHMTIPDKCD
jgi:hypothetical protein